MLSFAVASNGGVLELGDQERGPDLIFGLGILRVKEREPIVGFEFLTTNEITKPVKEIFAEASIEAFPVGVLVG